MRCYLNTTFDGGGTDDATADVAARCPGGRLTKIPYFLGGGSGGTDGGNDGSRILKLNFSFSYQSRSYVISPYMEILP